MGVIYSCHKDDKSQATAITDPAVAQAKTWYEATYPMTASNKSSLATQSIPAAIKATGDLSQLIKPDWLNVAKYNRLGKSVIEMPVDPSVYFGYDIKNTVTHKLYSSQKYNRAYFLLLNDGKTYQAYVMMILSDSAYIGTDLTKLNNNSYRKHDPDFTGLVIYLTPKGKYAGGYAYQKGKLVMPSASSAANQNITRGKTTNELAPENCVDWYHDEFENGELVSSTYLYTICTPDDAAGTTGGGAEPPPPTCPTTTTGSDGGSTPVADVAAPINNPIDPSDPGDGGYPPPTPNENCTIVGGSTTDFGEDDPSVCLNCRIAQSNFSDFLAAVQSDGYTVGPAVSSYAVGPDGSTYTGIFTPIYDSQGNLVATYFTPASTAGPFEAGTQYNLGTGTAGTSTGTGNNVVIFGNSSGVVGPGITYPPIGGGSGNVLLPTITDKNLQACLQNVLTNIQIISGAKSPQDLIDAGGTLAEIINEFSGNIPGFNWTLSSGNTGSNNAITNDNYNKSLNSVTTTFSSTAFSNASDISIARTILHESVHAYLVMYFTNNPITGNNPTTSVYSDLVIEYNQTMDYSLAQHNTMTLNFMNNIAMALQQYGNSQGYTPPDAYYYSDLAWGGLATDASGNPTALFLSLVPDPTTQNRILNRIAIEQTGYDLNNDPQPQVGKKGGC